MANKKNWLMIKRGLSQDPKHREAMGIRIWLYMHILDRTDWESGIVYDWRDKDEADDMCMEWRTLQRHRQELQELGYIRCEQNGNGQTITVYNWVNPKNYSGEIINPKGTQILVPLDGEGTAEGTYPLNRELRTPTLRSGVMSQAELSTAESIESLLPSKKSQPTTNSQPHTAEEYKTRIAKSLAVGQSENDGITKALETLTGRKLDRPTTTESKYIFDLREWGATPAQCAHFSHFWSVDQKWRGENSRPTLKDVRDMWDTAQSWKPVLPVTQTVLTPAEAQAKARAARGNF